MGKTRRRQCCQRSSSNMGLILKTILGTMAVMFGDVLFAASSEPEMDISTGAGAKIQVGGTGGLTTDVGGIKCTVLQGSTTYKQHNAPTDIMGLFSAIYDRVNEDLDDVVQVEINYVGDVIHRLVGTHDVQATVTRVVEVEGGQDGTQEECLVVPVVIEDSNECTLPRDEPMRHECHPSAVCVNNIGSYSCTCTGGEPCVPKSGKGLCSRVTSSDDCCVVDLDTGHSGCRDKTCASDCRRDFRCYTDQCEGKCVYPGTCQSRRGLVSCKCKEQNGEVGNGKVCPGETPTLYADANGNIISTDVDPATVCGCQVPTRDLCHGVTCGQHSSCREIDGRAKCTCKPGFRDVPGHGCMDDSAPALKLRGPAELTMKQCEKYVERGVEVMDSNSENDDRKVGVTYSQPPGKCTPEMGSFTVNYTLNTGWTHPAVQYIVRHVTVTDVDECTLDPSSPEAQCPGCRAQCHEHAKCENRVGTYTCKCPTCMEGDGFEKFIPRKSMRIPPGFDGGTGCTDSCAPVITLKGDNPLVLTVAVATNLEGRLEHRRNYTAELEQLIASTEGAGLCEDEDAFSRCATVLDNNGTHSKIDVTDRLNILKPVQISSHPPRWTVTYEATDEAGNYAEPVNRIVEIQELTVDEYADMMVQEALAKKGRCPECVRECPAAPPVSRRCPPCEAGDCSKCPCKARPDCVSIMECADKQCEVSQSPSVPPTEEYTWMQFAIGTFLLLSMVWAIVVVSFMCGKQSDPTVTASTPAAAPATPAHTGSRSAYAASPTRTASSAGGPGTSTGRAPRGARIVRGAENGIFGSEVRPITPNSSGGR